MLEEVYSVYRKKADEINWKTYNCNDLFFEYIKHENDELAENYYSAIVCRYWGYAGRVYKEMNRHVPFDQCYDILIDTINYVLEKRVWENKDSSIYNDKSGPDKAFHVALKRQKSIILANLTAYKRKSNFNTLSIDEIHETYNDASEGLFNIASSEIDIPLVEYIKAQPSTLDILFLDNICFSEWSNLKTVVRQLKKLTSDNFEYYKIMYNISKEDYNSVLKYIQNTTNISLLSDLNKLLYIMRKDIYND